jgi:multiple sugar transport system substrate-binding protein
MFDREKNLFDSYAAKRISRRELLDGAAKLGVASVAANAAFASSVSQAMAADFNWKGQAGKSIKLLLNKHPYVDAMIGDLEAFKSLTGMNVTYDIFPEDVCFDKVTAALSSKSEQYDAFMTGAYMTWTHGPAGWIEDLNAYIKDASLDPPAVVPRFDDARA